MVFCCMLLVLGKSFSPIAYAPLYRFVLKGFIAAVPTPGCAGGGFFFLFLNLCRGSPIAFRRPCLVEFRARPSSSFFVAEAVSKRLLNAIPGCSEIQILPERSLTGSSSSIGRAFCA